MDTGIIVNFFSVSHYIYMQVSKKWMRSVWLRTQTAYSLNWKRGWFWNTRSGDEQRSYPSTRKSEPKVSALAIF
jgi:hypothetical protein